ncbi:MAG: response regulator transcription factor [Chloroflexi bacterium]|uniref:Response regulator transcription factor n=1 Tax=Candidatus Chlorohelix allophototropha TaxID=3003348 RepID=A0A8T7M6T7_9CHLR|nr:response regulator transcription factor [Chloroflexota bacterium]WJW69769.1 response regulator transcription factor [Chloroflexota bacterium L227-S17]
MNQTILVVDDEQKLVELLRTILEKENYLVLEAHNGYEAIEKVRSDLPDLVLLDVMMPEMDGFEALKEIRQASNTPVIMLTVQATEADKVRGLELGADDYVAKPFDHRELLSRVKAVMRRAAMPPSISRSDGLIKVDEIFSIDFDKREVIVRGESQKLRPTEYRLLYHMVSNAGRLLSHESLLTKVWGREYRDDEQLLRLYITYLRQKIEQDPSHPKYILNERGLGYRFVDFGEVK